MPRTYEVRFQAFQAYISDEKISFRMLISLVSSLFPDLFEGLIRNVSGSIGILIRRIYYKFRLKRLGKKCIIDVGVYFYGPRNIEIGDYCWVDTGVRLEGMLGSISIGKRVHIAPYTIIGARSAVVVEDYAGIAAGVRIYSGSEVPIAGLHMSGPMIPEKFKSFETKPILIQKSAFVGANAVLLPGASLGEGSILGALSFLKENIPDWEIWAGLPAKKIGFRNHEVQLPNL
jgi:acetyltransferase-like isoleucine patch superfamily enzyme